MRPYWGSPPRVRGKVNGTRVLPQFEGITPACAGKSRGDAVYNWRKRDHPRVCGEKCGSGTLGAACAGSPPRVRGKAVRCPCVIRGRRITPACAGKRKHFQQKFLRYWDHPRVCGEKAANQRSYHLQRGSPPRVRGKVISGICALLLLRITPACAGKSLGGDTWQRQNEDHPRVCGEKAGTTRR